MEKAQQHGRGRAMVNGVELNYEVKGTGPHPIICIPGTLGTLDDFRPQMDYFGRENSGFTIVAFDPRGYGKSRPAKRFEEGKNFLLSDAKDAHTLMQKLSFPKYSVLGWSDGGIVSIFLASEYPDAVQKLIVLGANAYVSKGDEELYKKFEDVSTWSEDHRGRLTPIYGDSLQELFSSWIRSMRSFQTQSNGDICTKELAKITCSTLVVNGRKDPFVPMFHATYICDRIKDCRLEVFEEGEHDLSLKFPQEFNKRVENFLMSCSSHF